MLSLKMVQFFIENSAKKFLESGSTPLLTSARPYTECLWIYQR